MSSTGHGNLSVQKIVSRELSFHYRQSGSGPHMILIHGLTGTLADWELRVVPSLNNQFRVLTYDLRGHGLSDTPSSGYTSAYMASDLAGIMDGLGIHTAHVIGHSFGGTTALHFAALHPDRTIALTVSDSRVRSIQPAQKIKNWAQWPIWKEQLTTRGISLDEESDLDFSILEELMSKRAVPEKDDAPVNRRAEQWAALLSSTSARTDFADPAGLNSELIAQIRLPVQAIYGELSFCLPTLEGLKRLIPGLQSTVIPAVGHFFPITKPDLFAGQVRAFHLSVEEKRTAQKTDGEGGDPQ